MFTTPHRQKGGAPHLGARRPGEHGPFGPYGGWNEGDGGPDRADSVGDSDPKSSARARTPHPPPEEP